MARNAVAPTICAEHDYDLLNADQLHALVGGCRSNPGVRGLGGARMSIQSVCGVCGTCRTEFSDPSGQTEEKVEIDEGRFSDRLDSI